MTFDVEVNNLSLYYNDFAALNDLSFKLKGGKIHGLLGRNGAGKTSLLTLLASYRQATEGSIKIAGENPFENAGIMQHVAFHYETDYNDEWDTVKTILKHVERYRPYYDRDYALYLRSEEHTSELQSRFDLVCRLLLEKKKMHTKDITITTITQCMHTLIP